MSPKEIQNAVAASRRFVVLRFPSALVAFLGGSWAKGTAREGSDLDLCVIDPTATDVFFEATHFEDWIVDVCAIPPAYAEHFFRNSARYRSAPIPNQLTDAIVILGDQELAEKIQREATEALSDGPIALSEKEILDLRWELTALMKHYCQPATGCQSLCLPLEMTC